MNPKLIVILENGKTQSLEVQPDSPFFIGRDNKCEIVVAEKKVSRQHARILYLPSEGRLTIEDLNSLNGTRVNDQKIMALTDLQNGDRVRVGAQEMTVSWAAQPARPAVSSVARVSAVGRTTDLSKEEDAGILYDYFSEEESKLGQTDGKMISGKLDDMPLPDMLQMLATTRKTGELIVSAKKIGNKRDPDHQASIYMKDGQVLFVQYAGKTNEAAFYNLLRLQKGFFALYPLRKDDFSNIMETPLEALLLEGLRILDEEASEPGLTDDTVLQPNPDEPLTGLKPDELRIFQLAWKQKKVGKVMEQSPFGRIETEAILVKLIRNSFLKRED